MFSLRLETFPEIIQALFIYKSDKELKVKEHIFLLLVSYVIHSVMNFVYLGFVLDFSPIWFADRCFTFYCLYVIVTNLGIPFVDRFINFPVYTPLTNTLREYLHLIINKISKKRTPSNQPAIVPVTPIPALYSSNQASFPGMYFNNQASTAAFPTMNTNTQATAASFPVMNVNTQSTTSYASTSATATSAEPSLLFRPYGQAAPQPTLRSSNQPMNTLRNALNGTGINLNSINVMNKTDTTTTQPLTYQDYPSYDLKRMLQESERLDVEARQQTRLAPCLSFAPSIQPPRPPVKRMDKTLWQLSRTDKMEEEFREEQVALLNENWEKVVTSDMRSVFRDRLTKWLSSKVFLPLATGISELDQQIHPHSITQCPENILASIMYFNPKMMILKESIYLPGYSDSLETRQYVAERIKDLGSCDNLQSYHWTKKSADLPGDDIILMHCFKTFMKYEMPNVVPPLISEEGGVFLFLLVFFFITEELKDQLFHM